MSDLAIQSSTLSALNICALTFRHSAGSFLLTWQIIRGHLVFFAE